MKEQKGPVSAISHVLGFLVTAVGQKIYLWQLKDNDLNGVAFIDTNIFVHQITTIKSLLLVADMYKSISLLRFQVWTIFFVLIRILTNCPYSNEFSAHVFPFTGRVSNPISCIKRLPSDECTEYRIRC